MERKEDTKIKFSRRNTFKDIFYYAIKQLFKVSILQVERF